jgi:hypothetical protein
MSTRSSRWLIGPDWLSVHVYTDFVDNRWHVELTLGRWEWNLPLCKRRTR